MIQNIPTINAGAKEIKGNCNINISICEIFAPAMMYAANIGAVTNKLVKNNEI